MDECEGTIVHHNLFLHANTISRVECECTNALVDSPYPIYMSIIDLQLKVVSFL